MPNTDEQLFTIEEVAQRLDRSKPLIALLVADGRIASRKIDSRVMISESEVERCIASGFPCEPAEERETNFVSTRSNGVPMR